LGQAELELDHAGAIDELVAIATEAARHASPNVFRMFPSVDRGVGERASPEVTRAAAAGDGLVALNEAEETGVSSIAES
jgi:hypothetical protein